MRDGEPREIFCLMNVFVSAGIAVRSNGTKKVLNGVRDGLMSVSCTVPLCDKHQWHPFTASVAHLAGMR